jgi:glycosyltransferase involved in cell wall biosynthesis
MIPEEENNPEQKPYTVIIEKEYKKLSRTKPTIGAIMMVKNEHKRIHVSLNSVVGHVDALIIYDTGSTDNTVDIIKEFSKKHEINLYMISGEFIDFATSRNVSLEYADTKDVHYLVLLDTNDELKNGEGLREFAKEQIGKPSTGYLMCQEWWSGQHDKYYNVRFVKAHEGWRYRGTVHEWMKNTKYDSDEKAPQIYRMKDDILLYQDRTKDDDKSTSRFSRDYDLLIKEHQKDRDEPRTAFYLAQTCACLNNVDDAYYFYKIRTELKGFQEERFHAFLRCGDLSVKMGHDWVDSMGWFMKAFEHSHRVEPLIHIIEHYRHKKKWLIAYTFADLACKLNYPDYCILFVDKLSYKYKRWHNLGIIGWYAGFHKEGKIGCLKAIECGLNNELDTKNLKFYTDEEEKNGMIVDHNRVSNSVVSRSSTSGGDGVNKKGFMNNVMGQLKNKYPTLTPKQLGAKATKMWKDRKK